MYGIIIILVIIMIFLCCGNCGKDGLSVKPDANMRNELADTIMKNKEVFVNSTLYMAKDRIDWIDPVTYEDLRMLSNRNAFTKENVIQLLS